MISLVGTASSLKQSTLIDIMGKPTKEREEF